MADEADLGTAYGTQQEDINDKLVLDLAWERQQKKVSCLYRACVRGCVCVCVCVCIWRGKIRTEPTSERNKRDSIKLYP